MSIVQEARNRLRAAYDKTRMSRQKLQEDVEAKYREGEALLYAQEEHVRQVEHSLHEID